MRIFSTIVGTTALMGTSTMSADPDIAWAGDDDGLDIKLRGKFEAEAKVELEAFTSLLKEKHGRFYDRNCAEACFRTPGCRFDPHKHWSYCKYDHHPATCFGLYHVPKHHHRRMEGDEEFSEWGWGKGHKFGKLCYEPTQPHCPEQFPVYCRAHRHPMEVKESKLEEKIQKKLAESFEDDLM
jgi:hypothetical protein